MLILASASPRRRELLARIVAEFRVVPSGVDEALDGGPSPAAVAAVALRKARAVASRHGHEVVLAADTVVVIDGAALGKPADPREARAMLRRLRGRPHEVITGLALVDARTGREGVSAVTTRVLMRDYGDDAIEAYVASGEPFDKAGGYAIQEAGGDLVGGYVGSYSNIVGLPLEAARRLLAGFGVPLIEPAPGSRA